MVRLDTCRSSRWLANLFDANSKQLEGKIIVTFDNSFVARFNSFGLVHFTAIEDNLSPFTFVVRDLDVKYFSEATNIIYQDNLFIVNDNIIRLDENIITYNESRISPVEDLEILEIPERELPALYSEKFNYIRNRIIDNLLNNRDTDLIINLLSLLGMGEGLTPSGDDYITGLMYGFYSAKNLVLINKIKEILVSNLSESTTMISESFLRHAIKGRFSNNIVENNWSGLLNYGHTSGYFTYLGILDSTKAKKLDFQR